MYRDASNYKAHGQIHLEGALSDAQATELKKLLHEELYCVPEQLGLEHLGVLEWGGLPYDDDHGWHELYLDERESVTVGRLAADAARMGGSSQYGGTVTEFMDRVRGAAAAGWKES
ncbi:hypothetical protein BKG82_27850 [Mycobacteroides chelonae]|uniref:Uncharacterized protein n=2 Tax=Mycobacteroides chelonae TaxID=1774 RepID=A0A1S1LCN7_MYCCH|nr:hypothetical protein BKG82_27850 [Mycobacteroides chelonae]